MLRQLFEEFNLHAKSCAHQASAQRTTVPVRLGKDAHPRHSADITTGMFLSRILILLHHLPRPPPITTISQVMEITQKVFKAVTMSTELIRDVFPRHGNQDGILRSQRFTQNTKDSKTIIPGETVGPLEMKSHVQSHVRIEVAVPLRVSVGCLEDRDDAVVRSSSSTSTSRRALKGM